VGAIGAKRNLLILGDFQPPPGKRKKIKPPPGQIPEYAPGYFCLRT